MLLVGDWAPGRKQVKFSRRETIIIANLEGPLLPLTHSMLPAPKAGPNIFSCKIPEGAKKYIFSLANNHIMDYGFAGLQETIQLIDQKGFKACGAGKNAYNARQPITVEFDGVRIGILACCEAQFGVARHNQPGVAEFGPWIYDVIHNLQKTRDAVIVSVHAGVEDSPWPYPYIRELYQSFIDAGALIVHGHHAHVPQGYEEYGRGVIFYGLGNFAVDPDKWCEYPHALWSLGADVDFCSDSVRYRLMTFEIRHQTNSDTITVEESSDGEQQLHRRYLEICNRPFSDNSLFEALWQEVALRMYYRYGAKYLGFSVTSRSERWELIKEHLLKIRDTFHSDRYNLMLPYHMLACESHRQMLTTALGVLTGEIEDLRTSETQQLVDRMMLWSCKMV